MDEYEHLRESADLDTVLSRDLERRRVLADLDDLGIAFGYRLTEGGTGPINAHDVRGGPLGETRWQEAVRHSEARRSRKVVR